MNIINSFIGWLDHLQQKYHPVGFVVAVIRKFSDDEAGYQGALITYYGFLSLFPLLLVATSIIDLLSSGNQNLVNRVMNSISTYFPVLGETLERNIHNPHQTGFALLAGTLFTLYGARGGADAFRGALNHIWHIPKNRQITFPKTIVNSLSLIFIGGTGLVGAALLSAYASGLGKFVLYKIISVIISLIILFLTFYYLFRTSIRDPEVSDDDITTSALLAAGGIFVLQVFGGYLVSHQLKSMSSLYGTFAVVLGMLFWIYLQVEVVLYALEVATLIKSKEWPRSIRGKS